MRRILLHFGMLLLAATPARWAQQRNEHAERLTPDGSLETTMKSIQDKLNSVGPVNYVTRVHDPSNGHDWTNKFKDEVSRLVANSSACHIYYHWFTSVEGNVTMDKDIGFALDAVQKIRVVTREEMFNSDNATMGRSSWSVKVEPRVYVLVVQRPAVHLENHFVFFDQDLANRVSKSLAHAVELCGGKISQ